MKLRSGGSEQRAASQSAYNETYEEWFELVDDGDTESLTQEVIETDYNEALALYYELMATSPYLSEQVMIESIQKEFEIPMVLLTEILSSNPHAAKSRNVQQTLDSRLLPLSEYMREEINDGLNWVSYKEQLEYELFQHSFSADYILAHLIHEICANDTIDKYTELENLLLPETTLKSKVLLAELYYSQNHSLEATADALIGDDLNESDEADWDQYWATFEKSDFVQKGGVLSIEEVADLEFLANNGNVFASGIALGTLIESGMYGYNEVLEYPETENRRFLEESPIETTSRFLQIIPNPASELVQINIVIPVTSDASITILDASGREVEILTELNGYNLVDVSKFQKGLYLVQLKDGKKWLSSEYLIVQ